MSLAGTRVRNIRLEEPIDEGGMAEVWLGIDEKLGRKVAVKAIRAERRMDKWAKERFMREARILSSLEHPNICRLYDFVEGEDTDFLVLELVDGVTLRQAMEKGMDRRQALAVVEQVADALVAAHSMSVVHRDLKPENVMITSSNEVKVLDFGLARSLPSPTGAPPERESISPLRGEIAGSDDRPLTTQPGDVMGTPRYMSPEQARGESITAASDIYSFGLMVQEALTGRDPYGSSLDLMAVKHKASWGETRPARGLNPAAASLIKRMKAFSPLDRPSAVAVAERLRWIRDTPRRRLLRGAAAVAVLSLVAASVVSLLGLRQARRSLAEAQEARAQTEAVNRFVEEMLASADPGRQGIDVKVVEVLDRAAATVDEEFAGHPGGASAVHLTLARTYRALGQYAAARAEVEAAVRLRRELLNDDHPDTLTARDLEAVVARDLGRLDEAERMSRNTLEDRRRVLGPRHLDTLTSAANLSIVLQDLSQYEEAEILQREVVEQRRLVLGEEHDHTSSALIGLGTLLARTGRHSEAEQVFQRVFDVNLRVSGERHPATLLALHDLGASRTRLGRLAEAEECLRRAMDLRAVVLGPEHPDTLQSMRAAAICLRRQSRLDEAEALMQEVLEIRLRVFGEDHPRTASTMNSLAVVYFDMERYDDSEALYRQALEIEQRVLGPGHKQTLITHSNLCNVLTKHGRLEEAELTYREIVDTSRELLGNDHPDTLERLGNLGVVVENRGDLEEAESLTRQAYEGLKRVHGSDHRNTLFWQASLAAFLHDHGRSAEAEPHFRQALEGFERLYGTDHPRTEKVAKGLADCERALHPASDPEVLEAAL